MLNRSRLRTAAHRALVALLAAGLSFLCCLPLLKRLQLPLWAAAALLAAPAVLTVPLSLLLRSPAERSLSDLLLATRRIAGGDYSVRVRERGAGELRELLHSFNRMTEELGNTELLRSDFIDSFSHEFKTPINSICGFAGRLRHRELDPKTRETYLDYIISESRRLAALSDSILLLSRFGHQTLPGKPEAFSLDEQIVQCILGLQAQWEARRLRFDMQLPPLRCHGSEDVTVHIWQNLLRNAIKFSPEGGVITLTGTQFDDAAEVRIRDEGPGMDPETVSRIFEPFFQGDPAHSAEGIGLGLPLVRRAAALSGGTVSVSSSPGQGATFTVRLPS